MEEIDINKEDLGDINYPEEIELTEKDIEEMNEPEYYWDLEMNLTEEDM